VEYWDNLGWRDRWSSKEYSERQRAYAGAWGSDSIYTPEFVVNGREWGDWPAAKEIPTAANSKAGILRISSEDGTHWKASFVSAVTQGSVYDLNAALLDSEVNSEVKGGENKGRHLNHDFAVLRLVKQPLPGKDGRFNAEFTLDTNPPATHGRLALAAWITHSGNLEPLQAAGGWLAAPVKN
jgi:hypothetical protein